MGHEPIRTLHVDQMAVHIFATNEALGARAADDLAAIIGKAIDARGQASLILATPGIPWLPGERFERGDRLSPADGPLAAPCTHSIIP